VRAQARSSRVEKSKLRYVLEPLTEGRFSMVKGRHEWRLVGAEQGARVFAEAPTARRTAAGRISRLLVRLIQGVEHIPGMYELITEGFAALAVAPDAEAVGVEYLVVLRAVSRLGYVPQTRALDAFLSSTGYASELALQASAHKIPLARAINEALQASGL
jgi:recombinational DNA repair protein (RecF pathway)